MDHEGSIFLCGCAVDADFLFFAKEIEEEAKVGGPNSSFLLMDEDEWSIYDESGDWPALGMATIKPAGGVRTVVAVGPAGQYWEVAPLSMQESLGRISGARQSIRSVRAVGDSLYLVGMGRLVMERVGTGQWREMGPQAQLVPGQVIGFEDIAGFGDHELYAVGWRGEIWWRDQGSWRQVDSPVSANLNAVVCAPDGLAYVVGDNGTMLRGRRETWQVIDTGRPENLMDVGVHRQQVYVVTDFRILCLAQETLVVDVNFVEDDRPATCLQLLESADAIFSMGPSDLFRLTDGAWERLV